MNSGTQNERRSGASHQIVSKEGLEELKLLFNKDAP
jgi:hypothetical protein